MVIKTENIKNLWKFEGWKKEIPWILFWGFIILSLFAYKSDVKTCNDMIKTPCYQSCQLNEVIQSLREKNPGAQVSCVYDNLTNTGYRCIINGLGGEVTNGILKEINLTKR